VDAFAQLFQEPLKRMPVCRTHLRAPGSELCSNQSEQRCACSDASSDECRGGLIDGPPPIVRVEKTRSSSQSPTDRSIRRVLGFPGRPRRTQQPVAPFYAARSRYSQTSRSLMVEAV
jgi:hypothetical protein